MRKLAALLIPAILTTALFATPAPAEARDSGWCPHCRSAR